MTVTATRRLLPRGPLRGSVRVPGSKSVTNRALVAAALARGESRLLDPLDADDTRTLADALVRLGARVERRNREWLVTGPLAPSEEEIRIDVGPAGTPARFLAALLSALPGRFVLDGSPRMRERPMGPLVSALRALGAVIEPLSREGFLPLRIAGGTLRGGRAAIRGDVSSQFLSALLLVSPIVPDGIDLEVEGETASAAYLDLTRQTMDAFCAVPGGGYQPARYRVPADDSAACFPIAGAVISGGRVELLGLARSSAQPDAVMRSLAAAAGADVTWNDVGGDGEALVVTGPPAVRPLSADVDAAPDAALPIAAMLAFARGTSRLSGVARLREKESDRLAAAIDLLTRAGAAAREERDEKGETVLSIDGTLGMPRAALFPSHGDHRVAMSAAVLGLVLPGESHVEDPEVVAKSYPGFWDDWTRLTA
ncbi:MAG TPA: 3-phosphoshikimate 1-carboxyvinyltransferase [Thermoanaerobaculia bacterium]|nr:3-phosphoshikimate 1-carboxyvinyltransferase [Thermoanaerobaculia bacterium]